MRLEEDVLYLMSLVLFRYFDGMSKEFVRRKVGRSEWRCLVVLDQTGNRNIGELVELTQQPQATISRVVDRMERSGWVTRIQRERFVEVQITGKGRDKLAELVPAVTRQHEIAINGVSQTDLRKMHDTLHAILTNLVGAPHPAMASNPKVQKRAAQRKATTARAGKTRRARPST